MAVRALDIPQFREPMPAMRQIPLASIDPSPRSPRAVLLEIDELADSICELGLLQPIAVRCSGERYELIAGRRRLEAQKRLLEKSPFDLQWRTIAAVVRDDVDENDSDLMCIAAQVLHLPLSAREEAAMLERLATGRTLEQVAQLIHKSTAWTSVRLRLYSDSVLSGYTQSGRLSSSVAQELLTVRVASDRARLAAQAVSDQWSPAEARVQARRLKANDVAGELSRQARALSTTLRDVDLERLGLDARRDLLRLGDVITERIGPAWRPAA